MSKWWKKVHSWCNRYEWMIFLVVLVLVLRLPSFVMPHHYGDEEIYFVMGRAWSEGVPLYQAMFDHKPPLIYIMAGLAPTMFAFRGLLAIVMVIHTLFFAKLAEYFWQKTRPNLQYVSTIAFVLLTSLPTLEGLTVNAELLMMAPVTIALVLLWKAKLGEWQKFALAGLLGGIGWLFKIPVVADMVAIGLYFFVYEKKTLSEGVRAIFSKSFLAYVIAFVTPLLATFAYYYLKGTGPDYLATVLTVNLGYVSSWSTSTYTFNPFRSGLVVRGSILAGYALMLYLLRKYLDKNFVLAALWLGFSLFGALLSARPYPHYLQELMAPLALLIPFIFVAENVLTWIWIAVIVGIGVLVQRQIKFWAYETVSVYKNYYEYVSKKIEWDEYMARFDNAKRNYEIAKYLNERLSDQDQIYIWGTDPTIYNLTERLPSGGKYIVSFHVRDLNKYDYVMENLERSKPKYVVILPGSGEFDELASKISQQYVLAKTTDGAEIYILLDK